MAIDTQIVELLKQQDRRQSNYRQKSLDSMRQNQKMVASVDSSIRYNIQQTQSMHSGLGSATGNIIKAIKASGNDTKASLSKNSNTIESKSITAPLVEKLEEIRKVAENQRDIVRNYINELKAGSKYKTEDEPKEDNSALLEELARLRAADEESRGNQDNKDNKKSSIPWGTIITGGLIAILAEPLYRIGNTIKGLTSLVPKAINGAMSVFKAVGSSLKTLGKSIKNGLSKILPSIKNIGKNIANSKAFTSIANAVSKGWNATKSATSSIVNAVKNSSKSAANIANKSANAVTKGVKAIAKPITSVVKGTANATKSVLGGVARGASTAAKGAANIAKSVGGAVSKVAQGTAAAAKMIPAVGPVVKAAGGALKVAGKVAPLVSAGMEVYEAGKLLTMDPAERKKLLAAEQEKFLKKGTLNQMWYSFTNQSKTIAMAMQEYGNIREIEEQTRLLDAQNAQKELILERKKKMKEDALTPEVRSKKLAEMGNLKQLDFLDFESRGDLNQYLSTEEGKKYYEKIALEKGISKKDARAQILEDYKNFDFEAAEKARVNAPLAESTGEPIPGETLESAVEKNTQTFETLSKDLKEYMENTSNNYMVNNNTSITTPGVDYGERQRLMVAG